jgi:hypothetical protein
MLEGYEVITEICLLLLKRDISEPDTSTTVRTTSSVSTNNQAAVGDCTVAVNNIAQREH